MSKRIVYSQKARQALEKGMNVLARAAGLTLGPKGRNVIVENKLGMPKITDEGAIIVKEIELFDQMENIGALLLKQVASKTNDLVGDGATTATILTYAIVQEGIKKIALGFNPILLKKGIDKAVSFVANKILELSRPVETLDDINCVAAIASGNDLDAALVISKAIQKVGREGIISLEEGYCDETFLEVSEGISIEQGFISPQFLTRSDGIEICQDNPLILLTDKKIMLMHQDLISTLEQVAASGRSLLIIAEDIGKQALAPLIVNRLRGIIDVVAVRVPGFGDTRRQNLEDLSCLIGGQIVSESFGLDLSQISLDVMGSAKRVIISKNVTRIIAENNCENVRLRCCQISKQIDASNNAYEKEKLQNRLSRLADGVAVIKLGAATEAEMSRKKLRFEDAINSIKAAIDEGILPGGGTALLHLSQYLDAWAYSSLSIEEQIGARIVSKALSVPLATIIKNTGADASFIVEKIQKKDFAIGYDVNTSTILDMCQAGIVDPAKVTRLALQNASSIALTILTTECIIDG